MAISSKEVSYKHTAADLPCLMERKEDGSVFLCYKQETAPDFYRGMCILGASSFFPGDIKSLRKDSVTPYNGVISLSNSR